MKEEVGGSRWFCCVVLIVSLFVTLAIVSSLSRSGVLLGGFGVQFWLCLCFTTIVFPAEERRGEGGKCGRFTSFVDSSGRGVCTFVGLLFFLSLAGWTDGRYEG
ncbi:hypothetical protein BZA05DRAFT_404293 [Tricharina praecox]|uniref:uncharacterized protein n=1 Tax=Tricharina praecox TaxID=43433 RepID=UPI00221E9B43|nr:uncharacterized protein BZA05DRAFT_404293 [Tricharina praecox]KAI5848058.1 hypothetical protein BZA05DRAFT_404293 [Tricharina praecox]